MNLVTKANAAVEARLSGVAEKHGLTLPQYRVLEIGLELGGQNLASGRLADRMQCSRGNMTGLLDRMERDGRIYRRRSDLDRRIVLMDITDKGRADYDAVRAEIGEEIPAPPQEVAEYLSGLAEGA